MPKAFSVITKRDSEGYEVATVLELRGCHTQAKSLDTLTRRIREAIELCLGVDGESISPSEFRGAVRPGRSMTKLPHIKEQDLIAALCKAGFEVIRIKESHHFLSESPVRV